MNKNCVKPSRSTYYILCNRSDECGRVFLDNITGPSSQVPIFISVRTNYNSMFVFIVIQKKNVPLSSRFVAFHSLIDLNDVRICLTFVEFIRQNKVSFEILSSETDISNIPLIMIILLQISSMNVLQTLTFLNDLN